MSTETPPVVDEATLALIDQQRAQAEAKHQSAESLAQVRQMQADSAAQRVSELDAVRKYMEAHLGMPLADLLTEVERELAEAEARYAAAHAVAEQKRQELRDWEGYRRITQRRVTELRADEGGCPDDPEEVRG
jgi:hypothetical protein